MDCARVRNNKSSRSNINSSSNKNTNNKSIKTCITVSIIVILTTDLTEGILKAAVLLSSACFAMICVAGRVSHTDLLGWVATP